MRNIVNISLPANMLKTLKREVREGDFATTSEFFRHLLRLWHTKKLGGDLRQRRKDFEAGHGKTLHSLRDLR